MKKRILLGIDANLSPATQYALRTVSEMIEQANFQLGLVLLNVIPVPIKAPPTPGMYLAQPPLSHYTSEQREEAEESLTKARNELLRLGVALELIEFQIRVGIPSEEIVKLATELQVQFIVIGSRGDSFSQRIRRFLAGSTSRRVLQVAPCPVMIVVAPKTARPNDLVKWYQNAITTQLQETPHALTILTPQEAAQKFAPPYKKSAGRKEIAAATLALEQLARDGILCAHEVKGELRYVND